MKRTCLLLSVVASFFAPPRGSHLLLKDLLTPSNIDENSDVSSKNLLGDEIGKFARRALRVSLSHRGALFSSLSSIFFPAATSTIAIEYGRTFRSDNTEKLTAISIPNLKAHPSEEVFFAKSRAHKVEHDESKTEGDLIITNHRVIFDSEDFHEYKLSDLKKVEKEEGPNDLILRFAGNNKARFRINEKEAKDTRDKFKRIWKGNY